MTLQELKQLLETRPGSLFQMQLPDGSAVPVSFHVTEAGRVQKTFIDCGGTLRESTVCQLQVWVGGDDAHRLEAGKMAAILKKAAPFLTDESMPVEIEYEQGVISQYTIGHHTPEESAVVLYLAHKHTDCLAPELCGLPRGKEDSAPARASCCGPSGCC